MDDVARRVVAGVVLLGCLVGMMVHYGSAGVTHDLTMSSQAALAEYDAAIGETVYFWGHVVRVSDDATVVDAGARTVTVPVAVDAPRGAVVQVYGEARPGGTVDPERVIVSPGDRRQLYSVSVLGVVVAALAFLRSWRFDTDRLAFRTRGDDDA